MNMNMHTSRLLFGTAVGVIAATLLIGCNKAPQAEPESRDSPSTMGTKSNDNGATNNAPTTDMGTKVDDSAVTGRVKLALMADPEIKSLDISVLTYKGEVQLTGFVNNQAQIEQASQIARSTEGAGSIKNELKVRQ
ncbi:MAG: BON domain-containing protein [Burkholderiales bacterium]|nr:BON domain-containing protein [Burkholderiales bacterium]